jgi:hypothetical protein
MRLIFGLLISLLLALGQNPTAPHGILGPAPSGGGGSPGHVSGQSCSGTNTTGYPANITCVFPNPIGSGHLLVLCLSSFDVAGPITWSGDSGTFTAIYTDDNAGGSGYYQTCVYVSSTGGGNTTITATSGALDRPTILGDEFTKGSLSGTLDKYSTGDYVSGSPTSVTSNSITPTVNGEIVIGSYNSFAAQTSITTGGGFTLGGNALASGVSGDYAMADEYQVQTTAAAITANFTQSVGAAYSSYVFSFK